MNIIRKLVRKVGFDMHRYRQVPDKYAYIRSLKINTVIDIGANTGQFAKEIRSKIPQAKIYSFEPIKECFRKLKENMLTDKNFDSFNFAIGNENTKIKINKSEYTPSSSILEMSENHKKLFPHTTKHEDEEIETKKLDDVVKNLNLEKEILIKIDVQGFEMKVIAGGEKTFKTARAIIIENSFIELYKSQPTFDDIYNRLKNYGFRYNGSLQEKIDTKTGQIISEDSLFVK